MDNFDLKILSRLQNDARVTNVSLAESINLSPAPCLRRVRELEQSGVIREYATLLDPDKVGWNVSVFIEIRLEKQTLSCLTEFEASIESYPEVMECYLMTGVSDYLLRVVAKDLASLQRFITDKLASIPNVATMISSIALKQVIRDSVTRRFRPILLTTLTTFCGLVPMMLEKSLQARFLIPMAVSLAFGVLFATIITLILVPALYMILEDFKTAVKVFLVSVFSHSGPKSEVIEK